MGFTLDSIFILGDCLLISFRTPLKITLWFFKRAHIHHLTQFICFFSSQEEKELIMPHLHVIALKASKSLLRHCQQW